MFIENFYRHCGYEQYLGKIYCWFMDITGNYTKANFSILSQANKIFHTVLTIYRE